ncbi:hypothetical protein Tco_1526551, partial [Tanacetum coccineum]
PIMLKKFESEVMVIQNKSHSDEEIKKFQHMTLWVSATDAARIIGIAPAMTKEHLLSTESKVELEHQLKYKLGCLWPRTSLTLSGQGDVI